MAYLDFKRYVWLINIVRNSEDLGGASFEDIDKAWQDDPLNPDEGRPLPRRTFHNHLDAIREIFGVTIAFDYSDKKYHIRYLDGEDARRRQEDLMAMLSINEMAERLKGMKGRIIYEEPPLVWPEWLSRVGVAMKEGRKIVLKYRKYGSQEASERLLAPYCLKLFKRRWYLLAKNEEDELRTYTLDTRTRGISITDEHFRMPKDFDPAEYFEGAFGVVTGTPERVVVKTFGTETDYWRSAPLHHSQKEIATGDGHSLFELWVNPNAWEFIQELLSRGDHIEVMEPESLRERMAEEIKKTAARYADFWQNEVGDSKDNHYLSESKSQNQMSDTIIPVWNKEAAAAKGAKGMFARKAVRIDVYKSNNEIFSAGCYRTDSGKVVRLPDGNDPMLKGTKVYSERFTLPATTHIAAGGTETSVANCDCLALARRMLLEGLNPAVLNLADCYMACGFYPTGSKAQEESLCRASTLSRSLYQYYNEKMAGTVSVPFIRKGYPMDYHFGGIYSPGVTVFRDSDDWYSLLDEPFMVSIISVAALDFNEKHGADLQYRASDGGFLPEGREIMKDKIRTIYRIALVNGHDSVVLGAFGCGAFRLKPALVAGLFHDILEEDEFFGRFREVRFAILERGDRTVTGPNGKFAPFYNLFENNK